MKAGETGTDAAEGICCKSVKDSELDRVARLTSEGDRLKVEEGRVGVRRGSCWRIRLSPDIPRP